jgi:hypothetical protein
MADRNARLAVIGFFLLALGALQLTIFEVLLHLNLLLAQQLVHHDLRTTCLLRSSWAGCFLEQEWTSQYEDATSAKEPTRSTGGASSSGAREKKPRQQMRGSKGRKQEG